MRSLPSTPSMITFYSFLEGGVLYLNGSRRLWGLNSMAAYIWCLMDEVGSIEEMASRLNTIFHISYGRALVHAKETIACFEREGLFNDGQNIEQAEKIDRWDITPTGPSLVEPESWAIKRYFQTKNHVFEFCCMDSSLGKAILSYLSYLLLDNKVQSDTRIAILPGNGATTNCCESAAGMADTICFPLVFARKHHRKAPKQRANVGLVVVIKLLSYVIWAEREVPLHETAQLAPHHKRR